MGYEEIVKVISQVGFPIAVATYSLVVLNKTMKENTEATKENTKTNEMLLSHIIGKGVKVDEL